MASWNLNPSKIHQQKEGTFYIRASYEDPLPRVSEGKPRLQELRKQNMKAGFQLRTIHFIHSPNMVDFDVPHLICSWNVPNSWNWTPHFCFQFLKYLTTKMTHLPTWIFMSIFSMWNKGSSTSFQPPTFFQPVLNTSSRKLEKKPAKIGETHANPVRIRHPEVGDGFGSPGSSFVASVQGHVQFHCRSLRFRKKKPLFLNVH